MRMLAGVLVASGLTMLSWAALAQQDLVVAGPGIALGALWTLAIALRSPRAIHTACLAATASLCVLSVILKMNVLVSLFCLSSALYGWDLALMDLRLGEHPQDATVNLARRYAIRCLSLGVAGVVTALLARSIHIRLSFFTAFALSCVCVMLFLTIHRRTRGLMDPASSEEQKKADG